MLHVLAESDEQTLSTKCSVEDDLDFEKCNVEDLSTDALKDICTRVGLEVEMQVFPYLLVEYNEEGEVLKEAPTEFTHEDYVAGAYECLVIEQELEENYDEAYPTLEEILKDDPQFVSNLAEEMLTADPNMVLAIEDELKNDEPELWAEINEQFKEGETLRDRLDLVTKILHRAIEEQPELLQELFDHVELTEDEALGDEL